MPSDKQVNYALILLGRAGYSTRFMNAQFKDLGASMRERSGTVERWLRAMDAATISGLIDSLKTRTASSQEPPTLRPTARRDATPTPRTPVRRKSVRKNPDPPSSSSTKRKRTRARPPKAPR